MENGWGLVPDDMGNGFVAVGSVFYVAGADGCDDGFFTGSLDAEGGMGEEYDDRIGCVEVEGGGIVDGDVAFQYSGVAVFEDDFMVWLPVDGELRYEKMGSEEGGDEQQGPV